MLNVHCFCDPPPPPPHTQSLAHSSSMEEQQLCKNFGSERLCISLSAFLQNCFLCRDTLSCDVPLWLGSALLITLGQALILELRSRLFS